MDLFSLGVFLVSFVVCGGLVYFVSVLGTKEQTYEDALRMSRRKMGAGDHAAVAGAGKEKKDKKPKWGRKPAVDPATANAASAATVTAEKPTKEPPPKSENPVTSISLTSGSHAPSSLDCLKKPENDVVEGRKKKKKPKNAQVFEEEEVAKQEVKEEIPEPVDTVTAVEEVREVEEAPVVANDKKELPKKKKKIVVEEVEEKVPVDEPVIVKEEAADKSFAEESPVAEKKGKKSRVESKKPVPTAIAHPHDLLSAVKKTTFEEDELQNLIDILLNKQQGGVNGGWVERGGQANEVKQLEKSLQDARNALREETSKVKSLTERWNQIRQEANMAKAQQAQAQRLAEGHQQEAQKYQQLLQQEESRRITEINNLQNQITYKHQQCQQLQATVEQLSHSQNFSRPEVETVRSELEQSQQARANLDQEVANLRNQIALMRKEMGQSSEELLEAREEIKKLKSESDRVEELLELRKKLESENASLARDNEVLCKKLSAAEERLLSNGTSPTPRMNGHHDTVKKLEEEKELLSKKYQEAQKEISKISEESKRYQDQVEVVTRDLKESKERNDALRNRNWKVMDALNKAEQSYQGLLDDLHQKNSSSSASESNVKEEIETSQKKLLSRLFPELELKSDTVDFSSWMEDFSSKVCESKGSGVEDLKKQVNHYKKVLNDTESILHRLQSSIESEEFQWKQKLSEKQSEVDSLKRELAGSNGVMEAVQSAEEMEEKLKELQKKLLSEEESKEIQSVENKKLAQKINELTEAVEVEKKVKVELGEQVARMNQLVSTGQEALQQEQKTVELLRDQVAVLKAQITSETTIPGSEFQDEA